MEVHTAEYEVLKDIQEAVTVSTKLSRALKPPESEDPRVMAWRWIVVVATLINSGVLTLHILLSWGWVPFFQGFGTYTDQKQQRADIAVFREEQLEWRIFDLKSKQCEAIANHQNPLVFTFQIDQAWRAYNALTGHDPHPIKCSELIINGQS